MLTALDTSHAYTDNIRHDSDNTDTNRQYSQKYSHH